MRKTNQKKPVRLALTGAILALAGLSTGRLSALSYDMKPLYPISSESRSAEAKGEKPQTQEKTGNAQSRVSFTSRAQSLPQGEAQAAKSAAQKLEAGDYIGAIHIWALLIEHSPTKAEPYLQRSILLKQIGDNRGALADLDKCLELNPNHVPALIQRAMVKHRLGDAKAALADADKALELNPNSAAALSERSTLRFATGDMQGALADYNQAATTSPEIVRKNSKNAPSVQGQITLSRPGQTSTTINSLESAMQVLSPNKESTAALQSPAPALPSRKPAVKDHHDKAGEATAPEEVPLLPLYSAAQLAHLNNTAAREINEKRFEPAVKTLKKLIKASPDYEHARENLVIAHNNWGLELAIFKPSQAATQFRSALFLDPSQVSARKNLNAILKELDHDPQSYEDRLKLAEELNKTQDREGAYVELSEALRLRNTPEARLKLSQVIISLDQDARSETHPLETHRQSRSTAQTIAPSKESSAEKIAEPKNETNLQLTIHEPIPAAALLNAQTPQTAPAALSIRPIAQAPQSGQTISMTDLLLQANEPKAYDDNFVHEKLQTAPEEILILGRQLLSQGNYRDAENLLMRVKERSRTLESEAQNNAVYESALESLIDLYVKTGQTDKAERHLCELAALQQKSKHPDDPQLAKTMIDYARILRNNGKEEEAAKLEAKSPSILSKETPELVP